MKVYSSSHCSLQNKKSTYSSKAHEKEKKSLSTVSTISTKYIKNTIERLRLLRYRNSTRRNYYIIWKAFNKFFLKLDIKPDSWEDRLTLFVGYLIDQNKQSATIKSYISAIKAVLKEDGKNCLKTSTLFRLSPKHAKLKMM